MLDAVKPGGRIIAPTMEAARYIEREVHDRKLEDVKVHSISPSLDALLREGHRYRPGKTHFDHTWFEQFYVASLSRLRAHSSEIVQSMQGQQEQSAMIRDRYWGPWI